MFAELPPELAELQQAEVAIEARVVVPRQWLLDELVAAKSCGKRLVAMTDTTLPASVVQSLLASAGAELLFDAWYVSNERRARKDQGGMWPLVAEAEGVSSDRWLHIGDNERSDIQRALECRVGWSHVPSPRAVAQFYAPHGQLERCNWATQAVLGLSACALYPGRPVLDEVSTFGYGVLGPIVAAFTGRLVREHAARPETRMLLLARDTGLLREVLDVLRPGAPEVLPEVDYFLVSRRAALAVTQAAGFEPSLVLDSGAFEGSFADMVEARLGFRAEGERFDVQVTHPAERERCAALLAELADELVAAGGRELAGLHRYLHQLDIRSDTPLCLVDLGYSATTQRALSRVLPNPISGLYCATTPAASQAGAVVEGYFAEAAPFLTGNWFLDHSLLLEALLSSAHGAVLGYTTEGGEAVRLAEPVVGTPDDDRIHLVQRAALRFCVDLVSMYGPAVLTDPVDPAAVLSWVQRVPAMFLRPPEELFAGLRIENGFVGRPLDPNVNIGG